MVVMDDRFINRELSWLAFDDRVLQLASERGIPLLERAKFCAITTSNLDEFFQVRVAALKDQVAAGVEEPTADGRTATQQLAAIKEQAHELVARQEAVYLDELVPALAAAGLALVGWDDLDTVDRKRMTEVYEQRIFPVLTPLAVDPSHPFPYISELALSVGAMVANPDPDNDDRRFARVKVPTVFPRLFEVDEHRYIPAEELILAHLHTLFSGMEVEEVAAFRVTRNADLTLEDEEAEDLLEALEMELRRRRFNKAVRLEVSDQMSDGMLDLLVGELEIRPDDVYRCRAPIDLGFLWQLHGLDRPDLKDRPWPPVTAGRIAVAEEADRPLFSVMRDRAIFVHHPYESFTSSTEAFIEQAAEDPRVQSIKMTLYRAGGDSPIIRSLIRAAERGVQVAVLVELKARFDEATNVSWAKQLERAGVHVVYGMVGLKTHSKCVLVVRDDGDQLRRYCHIGTGNYNTKTARLYEDLGILTCDPDVGADVAKLFNHLTGYSRGDQYHTLFVAPRELRPRLLALIEREARLGSEGRITLKMNSIGDADDDRGAVRGQPSRHPDRHGRARHLVPARRRPRAVREHPRAQHPRALPRAQPDLPLRPRRRRRPAALPHRVGRPDAPQPRPPRRGAGADRAPQAPRVARPGHRLPARRRHRAVGAAARRHVGPLRAARRLRAPRPGTALPLGRRAPGPPTR